MNQTPPAVASKACARAPIRVSCVLTRPLMKPFTKPQRRSVRTVVGPLAVLFAASCLWGPPSVPPSASLAPSGQRGGGPRTGSAFAVAYAGPRGEVGLNDDQTITVLFNRGMRALETPEDQGLPTLLVRTSEGKPITGHGRWVGTRGLLFVPETALPGGNRVVVTVPAGVQTLDGTPLGTEYTFEFSTPPLGVRLASPNRREGDLGPKSTVQLLFNETLDMNVLKAASHLIARHADGEPAQAIPFHLQENQVKTGNALQSNVSFIPDAPWPYDNQIELVVDAGIRGNDGPAPMEKPYTYKARSLGPLRLASFFCTRQTSEGRCRAHHDVRVTFTNPVAPDELTAHLKAPNLLAKQIPRASRRIGRNPRRDVTSGSAQTRSLVSVTPSRSRLA